MRSKSRAPSISVIVPTYNMAEFVGAAIDSVLDGDFDDVEVVVIDDGSTDGTDEVLSSYVDPDGPDYDPRVRYAFQPNGGKAAAVNRGFSLARGRCVTILDADDQLTPDSLSVRYDRFVKSDDVQAVLGGFEVFDRYGTHGVRHPPSLTPDRLRKRFYLHWRTPFHLNGCLFARELVEGIGPMDEALQRCVDGDYAMRLLDAVDRMSIVPAVVYRYRKHRTSRFDRLRARIQTARDRVRVSWSNYNGWRKWVAVPFGLGMDACKLGYELTIGNYKR